VVDLPEPVGPVTKLFQKVQLTLPQTILKGFLGKTPIFVIPQYKLFLSNTLKTNFSPKLVGRLETLKIYFSVFKFTLNLPSCGMRDSVISSPEIIFTLAITAC